jgi:uncharacterized protein
MRTRLFALLIVLLIPFSALAKDNNGGASTASVKQLMAVTKTKRMLDNTMSQIDGWMKATLQQAMAGKKLTSEQDKIAADMRAKLIALYEKDLSWKSLEPMFVDIYQKSFTQKEIDGMLAFYKSEAGQALISKMPIVMQSTLQIMRNKMVVLMPKIEQLTHETVEKMKAVEKPAKNKETK